MASVMEVAVEPVVPPVVVLVVPLLVLVCDVGEVEVVVTPFEATGTVVGRPVMMFVASCEPVLLWVLVLVMPPVLVVVLVPVVPLVVELLVPLVVFVVVPLLVEPVVPFVPFVVVSLPSAVVWPRSRLHVCLMLPTPKVM